jgi:hypothetical protein
MISLDLCLSKLPNEACRRSDKNGLIYVNLVLAERREVDQFGNTHTIYVSQSKAEREASAEKVYVGSGKETKFAGNSSPAGNPFANNTNPSVQQIDTETNQAVIISDDKPGDDLPF